MSILDLHRYGTAIINATTEQADCKHRTIPNIIWNELKQLSTHNM